MKNNDKTMISVSVEDAERYLKNLSDLLEVHFNLIGLFEQEDELKKHHRPYLHVREKIAAAIEETAPIVLDIADQLCADAKWASPQDNTDGEFFATAVHCKDCSCKGRRIGCWNCEASPSCMEDDIFGEDGDDMDFPAEEDEDADSSEEDADALKFVMPTPTGDFADYFEAPDDSFVIMLKKDCDALVDRIVKLADQVRKVTEMRREDYRFIHENGKLFPAFAAFERDRLEVYKSARFEADEIERFVRRSDFHSHHLISVELPG